jgi:hypothetical protein
VRGAIFVEADLAGQQQRRLDARSRCRVNADGCRLDLGIGQLDLAFFLAHHEHERLIALLRNDLDVKRVWFCHALAAHPPVLFLDERERLFFTRRPGNCCGDRGGALRQWLVLVEHPDAKARLAAVFRKQSFQAEVAFLEEAATVRPLGLTLLVMLPVGMAFVVIMALAIRFAMVLAVSVPLGFSVGAVAVAISLTGRSLRLASLQNEGASTNAHRDDDGDGDQVLLADA